ALTDDIEASYSKVRTVCQPLAKLKAKITARPPALRQPHHHPRRRLFAASGREALQDVAGVEKPGLDQHRAGSGVVGEVAGSQPALAPFAAGPAERGAHRLGHVAAAPVGAAEPIADLRHAREIGRASCRERVEGAIGGGAGSE